MVEVPSKVIDVDEGTLWLKSIALIDMLTKELCS